MIIYNVTVKVEAEIAEPYLNWLKEDHIPKIMATGCFTEYRICRMLDLDEGDGPTLVVQYHAPARESYETYLRDHAPRLREEAFERWGNRFLAYRSLMEFVQ